MSAVDSSTPLPDAQIVTPTPDAGSTDAGSTPGTISFGTADRPAAFVLPPAHDGTTPLPLVILLHGYSASAALQDSYMMTSALARARGFYLILPDGTMDAAGNRFWNAQPACCDFANSGVDDVAYLTSLIDQAQAQLPIDPAHIYFLGHSNGGFMAYRMACEVSERLAAIGVLAGGDFPNATDCVPARPVSVLHIHGTADTTVPYAGGSLGAGNYVGAVASTERWATRAGCDLTMGTTGAAFDFDSAVPGNETTPVDYVAGCSGATVSLETMAGSQHIPGLTRSSMDHVMDWLLARTAP